jgi:RNA polymerase sigma factor (sigma-70 family)
MELHREKVQQNQALKRALFESPDEEFKFGFKVQVHNYLMRKQRQLLGLTQKELGRLVGISALRVSAIEGLRSYPSAKKAEAIAGVLLLSVEQLFPEWLRFYLFDKSSREPVRTSSEIRDALDHSSFEAASEFLNRPPVEISNPEEYITLLERDTVLLEALKDLKPYQRKVLVLRFGLDGEDPRTLAQVAAELGLSPGRVRELQFQGLIYLYHRHAKKLRSWL